MYTDFIITRKSTTVDKLWIGDFFVLRRGTSFVYEVVGLCRNYYLAPGRVRIKYRQYYKGSISAVRYIFIPADRTVFIARPRPCSNRSIAYATPVR